MLLTVLNSVRPAQAQIEPPPDTAVQKTSGSVIEYLVALPLPAPEALALPAGLSPEQATEYAHAATYKQAQPLLAQLQQFQAEGKISGFQVRPDLHAIAVQVASTSDKPITLDRLGNMGYVLPASQESLPACLTEAAKALDEQVLGLSRVSLQTRSVKARPASLGLQSTNPSIDVYWLPGSSWSEISGLTVSNTTVTLRILRGNTVRVTKATTSYSDGQYYFWPNYQSCPSAGYEWTLMAGDVVEVTANGSTISTVVVALSAWADPVANTVAGNTATGRSIEIDLFTTSSTLSQTVPTDLTGNFSANFSDFDRTASAQVFARDANGNSTHIWIAAYRIATYGSSFSGYLKPNVDFTATLSRTGSIISSYSGKSEAGNFYWGYFTQTIQAGDVIQVNGGGISIQFTPTSFNATLNPATNQATGSTGANRRVQAYFYKRTYGYVTTSCSWNSTSSTTTTGGSGNFTLNAGMDLARGDYAYFYVFDAEGNYQSQPQINAPAIIAGLTWNDIEGHWRTPGTYLTVILKDITGTVKSTNTNVWISSWDNSFYAYPSATIVPTDQIVVGDGVLTETMTVQNLTARLDGATDQLTGSANNNHLLAGLYDFRRDSVWWSWNCNETTVAGGVYNLTFSGVQPSAQDAAETYNTGPDGHYTYRYSSAFTINALKKSDFVWGYTETPDTPLTLTLQRSGLPVATSNITSSASGSFYAFLTSGTPVTITQGDILQAVTGDGDNLSLLIPDLTLNKDVAGNRLYGRSPANEPVRADLRRQYAGGWYSTLSSLTTADGAGNYSAGFNNNYWYNDCSPTWVGGRCTQGAVFYYTVTGHGIWFGDSPPAPAPADIYENDNTSSLARFYSGVQSHTFHTYGDWDWITFTVPITDVANNIPYHIRTFNLGWGLAMQVRLYAADATTLLADYTAYEYRGQGVQINWAPSSAGTYYLLVTPLYDWYGGYCDSKYDLLILPVRATLYLPLVSR